MNIRRSFSHFAATGIFLLLLPAAGMAGALHSVQDGPPVQGTSFQAQPTSTPRERPTATPTRPPSATPTELTPPTATEEVEDTPEPTSTAPPITLPSPTASWLPFTVPTPTPIIDPYDHQFPLTLPSPTPTAPSIVGPQVPDLRITHLEVTQGLQNQWNDMPLVAERRSYVRLYVETNEGDYPGIRGALRGARGGQQLGIVHPVNQPITAHEDGGGDRLNVDDSLYFHLPQDWIQPGDLQLEAFVYAVVPSAPFEHEPDAENNFFETEVSFQEAAPINISLLPIHLHVGYDADNPEKLYSLQEPWTWSSLQGMLRHIPAADLNLYPPPVEKLYCYTGPIDAVTGQDEPFDSHGECEFDLDDPGGMQYVTLIMDLLDAFTDDPVDDLMYYGMVHPDFEGQMIFYEEDNDPIEFDGIALNGQAYGIMFSDIWDSSPWFMPGATVVAHELAHRLGLGHAECRGDEENGGALDPGFPWTAPDCSLATVVEDGFYGFDIFYPTMPGVDGPTVISNDPTESEPNLGFPLMGYQKPQWIDAYHYCRLLLVLGVECDPEGPVQVAGLVGGGHKMRLAPSHRWREAVQTQSLQSAQSFLIVAGLLNEGEGSAQVFEVARLSEEPADFEDPAELANRLTDYDVALLDAAGDTVAASPSRDASVAHAAPLYTAFLVGLPFPEDTARIVVRHGAEIIAERAVSAAAPEVTIEAPNGGEVFVEPFDILWQASDSDGDGLTYRVQYSPDGGESWQALAVNVPDTHYRLASLDTLPGSDRGLIRVLANDGVNVGSDVSDATFSVPNSPPVPAIWSPGHSKVFASESLVEFSGSAIDREEGALPPAALHWDSDRDGPLGTGEAVTTRQLSPGRHVITLTATDAQGAQNQAVVAIAIDPDVVFELPSEAERGQIAAIFAGDIPGATESSRAEQGQQSSSEDSRRLPPAVILLGLAAAALAGLALMLPLVRSWLGR